MDELIPLQDVVSIHSFLVISKSVEEAGCAVQQGRIQSKAELIQSHSVEKTHTHMLTQDGDINKLPHTFADFLRARLGL